MGIVLCLFMALWFLSGVVMMYVGYPKLTAQERLQASRPVSLAACCATTDRLLGSLPPDARLKSLRFGMVADQPRLFAGTEKNRVIAIDARSGLPVASVDEGSARAAVKAFSPDAEIERMEVIDEDAWTHSKALAPHRPLLRFALRHPELALLYVSSMTGEVIRDVSIIENYWNWIGAWLHWLYPFRGGLLDSLWADIVIYSALIGSVVSVVGMALGVMRWRSGRYPSGRHSPYRNFMMRWHHVIGLFSGLFILAWVASGLFSVNPWRIFDSGAQKPVDRSISPSALSKNFDLPATIKCFSSNGIDLRELEWIRFDEQIHVLARNTGNQVWSLRDPASCRITPAYTEKEILEEGVRLMPHASLKSSELRTEYDWHYYARAAHTMTGGFEKPLPVLLLKFDDPHETWLYIDLKTSRLIQRTDDHTRVKRWLFSFFHSWDWKGLLDHRPLWDVLLIVGSCAGFLVSVTAMLLGWKRLRRRG